MQSCDAYLILSILSQQRDDMSKNVVSSRWQATGSEKSADLLQFCHVFGFDLSTEDVLHSWGRFHEALAPH